VKDGENGSLNEVFVNFNERNEKTGSVEIILQNEKTSLIDY
jgi:hypothetical protein